MRILVDMRLQASDRRFRLPGSGQRSLLYRFDGIEGQPMFGAWAVNPTGAPFAPGAELDSVALEIWADDMARSMVEVGQPFTVWYGGDVGEGTVTALLTDRDQPDDTSALSLVAATRANRSPWWRRRRST